ncbi:MAG: helix-turn-helix transcriptional regulator [Agriterribacter sp.]
MTDALIWGQQNKKGVSNKTSSLTDREIKVIQLLWEEKSNEEISSILFLGIRSIEKIRQDIKEKIGVKSMIGIMKYAIVNNIEWIFGLLFGN